MKKFFLALILVTFISTSQAQFVRGYGLKLGTTVANQDWEYVPSLNVTLSPDNRLGLNIGFFAELLNNPILSIVTEVNYVQKGMKTDIEKTTVSNPDGTGEFITWDTRVDYINLSALGKFRVKLGIVSPYVIAGPKIDFEINKVFSLDEANSVEENFNKNRIGFKVGIGAEINLMSLNLIFEFLYDADFNELFENENLKVNSNSIDLRVGLMI